MWKVEDYLFSVWSQGIELELVGGNFRETDLYPLLRELSNRAVRMEWAVSESSSMSQTLAVLIRG